MKKTFFLLVIVLLISSCNPAVNPNEHVVVTIDCWNSMYVKKAGQAMPRLLTSCDRMIILPASLLNGDVTVAAKFGKGRVKGTVMLAYQYVIENPTLFVSVAKFITAAKTTEDNKVDPVILESAENTIIDKLLADIVRAYTPTQEPKDIEENKIESDLFSLISLKFSERGIKIINPSINVDFSAQTEEALDVISAYNLYKNEGLEELGKDVIKAKASKTNIELKMPDNKIEIKK